MADLRELKQMVLSFRVSELHVLLGFAGRNKAGRKQELTQRALALVQKGCSLPVQIKIRELYRQIYPVGKPQNTSPPHKDMSMPLMQRHPGSLEYSTLNIRPVLAGTGVSVKADVRLKHLPFYDVLAEILKPSSLIPKNNGRMQETLFVFHLTPQQAQDITMSRDFRPGAKCEYAVQVQLRFCLLEPSCEQADIFPSQIQVRVNNKPATLPLPLSSAMSTQRSEAALVSIACQYDPLAGQYLFLVSQPVEQTPAIHQYLQVPLTFVQKYVATSCVGNHSFITTIVSVKVPTTATETVRSRKLTDDEEIVENVIPTNKPNVEPKRPGRPVDITNLCRLSPTVSNAITITWAADFSRSFCMSIYLVRKLSTDILMARLKQFGHHQLDHTKALIKEKLAQDADSEIATTSVRVSLMCPLGKMRMQLPCRASTCTHLQCFDASTFLMMNERKPTWMCPVCDRPCPYDKLIIDGYFVDIFQQSPLCNDIVFHEDGSWSPIKSQKENSNQVVLTATSKSLMLASPSISLSSLTATSLSSSSLSVLSDPPAAVTHAAIPALKAAPDKGPTIDLTLDSSDEDDDAAISDEDYDAAISSDPVINLDTPSPAAVSHVPDSPTTGPASPVADPASPTMDRASPTGGPSGCQLSTRNQQPPVSSHSYKGPKLESQPSNIIIKDNLSNTSDNTLRTSPSATKTSLSSSSSSSNSLQSQTLNLEAMSDSDFDEFLKGLSWGV